ncbi:GNAT family N-acetyltransferase [Desulfosarcina sp. OttesenSCG-928-B08]|nr:GNAT family N-acetyltransferase [Desulfosarcina sp. OttesenSCG-928-B08]
MNRNEYSNGKYNLRPVTDFSIFTGFTCCGPDDADRDLDDFIRDDAERHLQDKMAVTYGLFFPEKKLSHFPLAFFTLQNDALKIQSPGYPYKTPPAVKIGRFGVSFEFQSKGIGTDVLTMIKDFMCSDNRTGCRYITVDAYNQPRVLDFYLKNGFFFLKSPNSQRRQEPLYFDLLSHVQC